MILPFTIRDMPKVYDRQLEGKVGSDHLKCLTVNSLNGGPKGFMAAKYLVDTLLKHVHIEQAGKRIRPGNDIEGSARF
jgi:hypothetical protein